MTEQVRYRIEQRLVREAEKVCDELGLSPSQVVSMTFAQLVRLRALPFRPSEFPALKEYGAVYLHAIGGAAQFYARCLPRVLGVHLLEEIGVPEAMWIFEARNFPAIVTMDSHGGSLHAEVAATTGAELEKVGAKSHRD